MLDYIEQTSLKFHIERFIIDNIDENNRNKEESEDQIQESIPEIITKN